MVAVREPHPASSKSPSVQCFQRVPPWVTPVVKDLAAQHMAAHAPFMAPAFLFEPVMAAHQIIEVGHLIGGMVESRFTGAEQK